MKRQRLMRNFEHYADSHVYVQHRWTIFTWGFVYIPSQKVALKLAQKFKYRQIRSWPKDKADKVVNSASE